MSKHHKKSHASSTTRHNGHNNDRNGRNNHARTDSRHGDRPAPARNFEMRRGTTMPPVVAKSETQLGTPTYSSKFVAAKNGGLMAEIRVHGRIVFPDRRGPQPKIDGKPWSFEIIGENPKQTVYFARIIVPEAAPSALKIVIDHSGKMRGLGRRPIVFSNFHSTKQSGIPFAEFRSARPGMGFDHSGDREFFDFHGLYFGDEHLFENDELFENTEVLDVMEEQLSDIERSLVSRRTNDFVRYDDGTSSDWPSKYGVRPVLRTKGRMLQLL